MTNINDIGPLYAVIDIGTNSTRLMLARTDGVRLDVLEKQIRATRIGEKLASTGELSQAGMERTLDVIAEFLDIARAKNAEAIYAFGTSALREASNSDFFLSLCRRYFWLPIDVIDGRIEAQVSYIGAVPSKGEHRLLDIGGGSCELSAGANGKVSMMASIPMGAVRASELFPQDETGLNKLYRQMKKYDAQYWEENQGEYTYNDLKSKDIFTQFKKKSGLLYGVGGTITSLCVLSDGLSTSYEARLVHGRTMTRGEIGLVARELASMNTAKLTSYQFLRGREDIIQYGTMILMACMDAMEIPSLVVSDNDNLEGYLLYCVQNSMQAKQQRKVAEKRQSDRLKLQEEMRLEQKGMDVDPMEKIVPGIEKESLEEMDNMAQSPNTTFYYTSPNTDKLKEDKKAGKSDDVFFTEKNNNQNEKKDPSKFGWKNILNKAEDLFRKDKNEKDQVWSAWEIEESEFTDTAGDRIQNEDESRNRRF